MTLCKVPEPVSTSRGHDSDGSDPVQLTFDLDPKDQVPNWSTDGSRIAYVTRTRPQGAGDIWIIDGDGSDPRPITTGPEREFGAAWSPEGTRVQLVPGWQPLGKRLP